MLITVQSSLHNIRIKISLLTGWVICYKLSKTWILTRKHFENEMGTWGACNSHPWVLRDYIQLQYIDVVRLREFSKNVTRLYSRSARCPVMRTHFAPNWTRRQRFAIATGRYNLRVEISFQIKRYDILSISIFSADRKSSLICWSIFTM